MKHTTSQLLAWLTILVISAMLTSCTNVSHQLRTIKPTVYERVLQSGTIRCGYAPYPPYCMKDPNTGKLQGIFVEALEKAGQNLNLKIAWTEEVSAGTMIEGLLSDRYDLVPTGIWPSAPRARQADFSVPLFYVGIGAYVRANDNRFSHDLRTINSPQVTISTIDGQVQDVMAKSLFPHARQLTHVEMCDSSQIFLDVAQRKADLTLSEPGMFSQFLKRNPGTLKNIADRDPLGVFANTMMFKIDQPAFKSMLDTALTELINTGYVDRLIDKYEPTPGAYYRLARPYKLNSTEH